jgi:hypothetical protein
MLACPHIGGLGARAVTNPIVALDNDAANAAPPQFDARGQANRTCSDDQHLGVFMAHHRSGKQAIESSSGASMPE